MSASHGTRVGILPEVLAALTGLLADRVRKGLPESSTVAQLGGSMREIRDAWGVTTEAMAGIVPESWLEWGPGVEGGPGTKAPRGRLSSGS